MNMEETELIKLRESLYFVEATTYEILCIYRQHKDKWEENCMGCFCLVGYIDNDVNKPVYVGFRFVKFNDKQICFFETTSRYNDAIMVKNWIIKNHPVTHDGEYSITNALNFHNVLNIINI